MQAMEKSLGTVMVFLCTTLPSDSFIFNEAETGAMIVGCRKLVRLGVIEALMQDESSCANHMGILQLQIPLAVG